MVAAHQAAVLLLLVLLVFSPALSVDLPSHGCYWTESCRSKWFGGGGEDCHGSYIVSDHSDDCNGLCADSSSYPPCLPFHTRFLCCKPEIPKLANRCARCKNKMDFGDEYICCSDCSDPFLLDKNNKLGYCRTGAELAVQLKPRETFKWIEGPWMECSSPCDGGVRYRDVDCFGSTEDMSVEHFPVDDSRCSTEEMPARQESCNLQSCLESSIRDKIDDRKGRMSGWLVMLLVLLGILAVGGLGFAGYTFYKRRESTPRGFVYIMMDGYS